ncbi:DUF4347 domain-containing protein [Maridesulfovibrio sp.]|uniref:DUF4347 domain-containing protein n=1 Tax=Maridesulfovibrio sp. TaxID=2795000 RepID=UPI002A18881B|nr:DUF4347 domain-containing protein [Maridesulfovibrio sp.]
MLINKKVQSDNSNDKPSHKAYALEPRILFDAAAPAVVADLVQAADNAAPADADDSGDNAHSFVDNAAPPESASDVADADNCDNVVEALEAISNGMPQKDSECSLEAVAAAVDFSADENGMKDFEVKEINMEGDDSDNDDLPLETGQFLELKNSSDENSLVVVDSSVENYEDILAGLDSDAEVHVIEQGQDGIAEISKALAERDDVSSVHILSHGSNGSISLGGTQIDASVLSDRAAEINKWSESLTADADILLYGCSVAEDGNGKAMIEQLSSLTDADVAASDDATGSAAKGGDWDLEFASGEIESNIADHYSSLDDYEGLLAAPSITDSATSTRSVAEDTNLSITGVTVGDSDDDNLTVQLTVDHGTIKLASVANLTIDAGADGSSTVTVTGTVADINTALSGMTFKGSFNYNGNAVISLAATDATAAAPVTTNGSVTVEVVQVNDDPTLTSSNLSVNEGQANVSFGEANFGLSDPDIDSGQQVKQQQIVQIKSLPTKGTLKYNGSPVAVGSSFSYDQVAKLTYSHDGSDVAVGATDTFNVNVYDGAGGEAGVTAINISLQPVNAAPSISRSPTVHEGETISLGLSVSDEESGHADTAADSSVTIVSVNNQNEGTLFRDINDNGVVDAGEALTGGETFSADNLGQLKFVHDGDEPGNTKPSFVINVTDAGGGEGAGNKLSSGDQTIQISMIEVDDDPVLAKNRDGVQGGADDDGDGNNENYDGPVTGDYLDVGTASVKLITNADLQVTDIDTSIHNLAYTITALPSYGKVQVLVGGQWRDLSVGGRFTQLQIDNNQVRYSHINNVPQDNTIDTFKFTVRDSELKSWQAAGDNTGQEGAIYDGNSNTLKEFTFNMLVDHWSGGAGGSDGSLAVLNLTGSGNGETLTMYEGAKNVLDNSKINYRSYSGDPMNPDYEVPANEILFRLTTLSSNTTLQKDLGGGNWTNVTRYDYFTQEDLNNSAVRLIHNGSEDFVSSYVFSVTDGTNDFNLTLNVDVTPINDQASASGGTVETTEALNGVAGSGIVRIDSSHMGMSDVDGANEVAKQAVAQGNADNFWFSISALPADGELQYWNGAAWTAIAANQLYNAGDGTNTLWFSKSILSATNVDGSTSGIRYVHNGKDDAASLTDLFKFYVRDDLTAAGNALEVRANQAVPSNIALTTPDGAAPVNPVQASDIDGNNISNEATVNISIAAFNDPPQVTDLHNSANDTATANDGSVLTSNNDRLEMAEGATETIPSGLLSAIDTDNNTIQRQYKVTDIVDYGTLFLNGKRLGVGSTFTQDDLDNNRVTYTHDGSENHADYFTFVVDDGLAKDNGRFDIIITAPLNDIPTVSVPGSDIFYDVGIPLDFGGAGKKITIGDADVASLTTGETDFVQVTVSTDNANSRFAVGDLVGLSYSSGVGVRGADLVLGGTLAEVQAALDSISYTVVDAGDSVLDLDQTVTVTVKIDDRLRDGSGNLTANANGGNQNEGSGAVQIVNETNNIVTDTFKIHASKDNDDPTFTSTPGPIAALEDTWTNIDTFVINDPDAFTKNNNTLIISVTKGILRLQGESGINGNGTGTITLSGTLAQLNTYLTKLQYKGNADYNGADTVTVKYNDMGNVGQLGGGDVVATQNIEVQDVNDAPTLDAPNEDQYIISVTPLVFSAANGNQISIDDAKDLNNNGLDTFTVTVSAKLSGNGYGILTVAGGSGANVTNDGTNSVTISGTKAQVNAALNGLSYVPTDYDVNNSPVINVTVNDQDNGGVPVGGVGPAREATDNINVLVSAANNDPTTTTVNANIAGTEDQWLSINGGNTIVFADSDTFNSTNNTAIITVGKGIANVTGQGAANVSGNSSKTLTITGSIADINATLATLRYKGDLDFNGTDTLTAVFNDKGNLGVGGEKTVTVTHTLNIAEVNDAPTRIGGAAATLPTFVEDAVNPSQDTVDNLISAKFSDAKDQVAGGSNADTFEGIVVIGNAVTAGQGTWQYSIDGGTNWVDIANNVSATNGLVIAKEHLVRFKPAQDYNGTPGLLTARLVETGGNDTTGATVNVSGGNSGGTTTYSNSSNQVTIGTSITAVNDTPTTPIANAGVNAIEDQWSAINGGGLVSFADVDAENTDNNTATVTVDKGSIRVTGAGSANVINNNTSSITITGTLADINTTLASLQYKGDLDFNGTVNLSAQYDDHGNSGAGGVGTTVALARTITVAPVNDAPTGTGAVTLPNFAEDADNPSQDTVDNLIAAQFSDAKDQVVGGSSEDTFEGIVVVGNAATAGQGIWQYSTDGGTNWVNIATNVSATNGLVIAKEHLVRFNPAADYNGTPGKLTVRLVETGGNDTSGVMVNVSGGNSGGTTTYSDSSNQVTIGTTVTGVNDTPTATIANAGANATEDVWSAINGGALVSFNDVDAGNTNNNTATVSVDKGTIRVTEAGAANVSNNNSGSITVTGTLADINSTLASLQYKGDLDFNGTVNLNAQYNDQGNSGAGGAATTVSLARTITVAPVNDAPTKLLNSVSLPDMTEDTVTPSKDTVSNLLSAAFSDAKDQVVGGTSADAFVGVAVVGNASTAAQGVWQYSTDGTNWTAIPTNVTAVTSVIISKDAQLRFNPTADYTGTPGGITVRLVETGGNITTGNNQNVAGANSGGATEYSDSSNEVEINTAVTPIDDAPVNTVPGNQTIGENSNLTFSTGNGNKISIADVDAGNGEMKVTLKVNKGTLTIPGPGAVNVTGDGTSEVVLKGTIAQINSALDGMKYKGNPNYHGADTLTITTDDQGNTGAGGPLSDTDSVNIIVTSAVDDPPTAEDFTGSTTHDKPITVVLDGDDPDGDLNNMEIKTLPNATKGTLYHPDGTTPVQVGDTFTPDDAKKLIFKPKLNQSGTVNFKYFTNDDGGHSSSDAKVKITITIPKDPETDPKPDDNKPDPKPDPKPDGPNTDPNPQPDPIPPVVDPVVNPPVVGPNSPNDGPVSVGYGQGGASTPIIQWGARNALSANDEARLGVDIDTRFLIELTDQTFEAEKASEFKIPAAAIHHTDPNAQLSFEATRPDGSPLPPWITFDTQTKAFMITPPKDVQVKMPIMVKAIDDFGNEAKAVFTIKIVKDGLGSNSIEAGPLVEESQQDESSDKAERRLGDGNQRLGEGDQDILGEVDRLIESLNGLQDSESQENEEGEAAGLEDDSHADNSDFSSQMAKAGRKGFFADVALIQEALSKAVNKLG